MSIAKPIGKDRSGIFRDRASFRMDKIFSYLHIRVPARALAVACMAAAACAFGIWQIADAAAPARTLGFQGQLYSGGAAVDSSVSATFTFYDALSGGSQAGSAVSKTVAVDNGYFSTSFDESDLSGIDWSQSLWIEVAIEGNALSPRSAINAVPFAERAFGAFSHSAAPTVGPAGSLYYNSATGALLVSNGSSWTSVGASSATTTLSVGNGFLHTATSTDGVKAAYFVATSTTATSTFAGAVGIGTTTVPAGSMLYVNGASTFNGNANVASILTSNQILSGGVSTTTLAWSLSSSLVSQYKMNDSAASTVVVDSAGTNAGVFNRANGSSDTADNSVAGKVSNTLNFNGSSTIDVAHSSSLSFEYNQPFTISFWFKASASGSGLKGVFGKLNTSGDWKGYYSYVDNANGRIWFILQSDNSPNYYNSINSSVNVMDDVWHHIVMENSGLTGHTTDLKIYIDGVEDTGAVRPIDTLLAGGSIVNSNQLQIGSRGETVFVDKLIGLLDDFRIYNRKLVPPEIASIYNSGTGNEDATTGTQAQNFNVVSNSSTYVSTHALDSLGDLAVSGELEVDGDAYFDSDVITAGYMTIGTTVQTSNSLYVASTDVQEVLFNRNTGASTYGGGFGNLRLRQSHNGAAITNGWGTGLVFALMDLQGNTINNTGSIYSHWENVADTTDPSYMTFNTKPAGGSETERIRITSTGNVGIGSSTPIGKLVVKGTGTGTGISFATTNSSNAMKFVILDNGSVGIGTSSPIATLSIAGTAGTNPFVIASSTGTQMLTVTQAGNVGIGTTDPSAKKLEVHSNASGVTNGIMSALHESSIAGAVISGRKSRGTLSSPSTVVSGDYIGTYNFQPYVSSSGYISTSYFGTRVNGTVTSTAAPTDFFISTGSVNDSDPFANGSVRLLVNSAGNVGIGQSAPVNVLHVGSTAIADATKLLRLQDADSVCEYDANTGAPACASDQTLKKNIAGINGNLEKILALRPVSYNWNTDSEGTEAKIGFIAQEVGLIMPELVQSSTWLDGSTRKFLSTGGMMPYLVGAIKEQHLLIGDSASSTAALSEITLLVDVAQAEASRSALSYIMERINSGTRPLLDLVSVRITAVRGYFDEVFAKKVHTDELRTNGLCVGETCITETELKQFLESRNGAPVVAPSLPVAPSNSNPAPEPEPEPVAPPAGQSDEEGQEVLPEAPAPESSDVAESADPVIPAIQEDVPPSAPPAETPPPPAPEPESAAPSA